MGLESKQGRKIGLMNPKAIERYARRWNVLVESNRGKHGKHLVSPNGKFLNLPDHGSKRPLAMGTFHDIIDFIHTHGFKR